MRRRQRRGETSEVEGRGGEEKSEGERDKMKE